MEVLLWTNNRDEGIGEWNPLWKRKLNGIGNNKRGGRLQGYDATGVAPPSRKLMHNAVIFTVIAFRLHLAFHVRFWHFVADGLETLAQTDDRQLPPCPLCRVRRTLNKPFQWPFFRVNGAPPRQYHPIFTHISRTRTERSVERLDAKIARSLATIHRTMIDENGGTHPGNGFQF